MSPSSGRVTVPKFTGMKNSGSKITMCTAYDFPMGRLADEAGVDSILVGHPNTLPVTLDQMIYHAEMVARAAERALVVVDLPFPTFHLGRHRAVEAAARILKETRAQAVKLEGGAEQAEVIAALVSAGIPVMGHCGLRPQTVHQLGGYKVQRDAERLRSDTQAAQQAGAFSIVLECIPADLATTLTAELSIPTIGIGAGPGCDGQVLVTYDLLGFTSGYVPRFAKQYADMRSNIAGALKQYCQEVRDGTFPGPDHTLQR